MMPKLDHTSWYTAADMVTGMQRGSWTTMRLPTSWNATHFVMSPSVAVLTDVLPTFLIR